MSENYGISFAHPIPATTKYSKDMCGVEPVDRTAEIVIVPMVVGSIALLAYGMRIIARTCITKGAWGLDDWVITAAVVCIHSSTYIQKMRLTLPRSSCSR